MIDTPVLIKDLQGALSTTLKMYKHLEKVRISSFNKKVSVNSANNMQRICNELEKIQSSNENFTTSKKMLPVLSQKLYPRTKTPLLVNSNSQKSRNYLKKYVKASNSRLCSSRAGNLERNLAVEMPEEYFLFCDKGKAEKKENNLEELFGQVHQLPRRSERYGKDREEAKKDAIIVVKKIDNPEKTLFRCVDLFKKVKEEQNFEFLKRIQMKLNTPELTRRRDK